MIGFYMACGVMGFVGVVAACLLVGCFVEWWDE